MIRRQLFTRPRFAAVVARLGLVTALLAAVLGVQPAPVAHAATYEVDRFDDNAGATACTAAPSDCSLRGAVTAANASPSADTIILPSGTYTLTITGAGEDSNATGDLDILAAGGDLTINGAGAGSTIISGPGIIVGTDRVFHIDPAGAGGITVEISGVTIRNGYASPQGGGIYNGGNNTVNIANSTFSHNEVRVLGGTGGGGGIYNTGGTVNIVSSTLSENRAGASVGGSLVCGGGIFNASGGVLNVTDSTIYSNTASTTIAGSGNHANGGGIYDVGVTVAITNSTLSENRAIGGGSGSTGIGGGVLSVGGGTVTIVAGSTLSNNQASDRGGGIYKAVGGTLNVVYSTISGNEVTASNGEGGGILNSSSTVIITGSTLSGNQAVWDGGGIRGSGSMFFPGAITITHSILSGNEAGNDGGGICNHGDYSTVTIASSTLSGNRAGDGGGAIANDNGGAVHITDSTISGNEANDGGGGIGNEDGTVTIANSTISGNWQNSNGGGIINGGTLTVTNSTISGNRANWHGGGLSHYLGTASLSHVTITGNTADDDADSSGDGGGIYRSSGTVNLKNSIVAGNTDAGTEAPDCSGTLTTFGDNVVQDVTGCTLAGTGTNVSADPQLDALADNGGSTQTHALQANSPAIDGVTDCTDLSGIAVTTDQRGEARPQGAACDVGAYEAKARVYLPLVLRNA